MFHESFAVFGPLALLGSALYPILVHRLAASLHASSPRSVALPQLRFASLVVINSREDFHLQECAHAGRTKKSRPKTALNIEMVEAAGIEPARGVCQRITAHINQLLSAPSYA
jgi:hypothetical protein